MANSFKVGDVVELKSGGPKMTVAETGAASGSVLCHWFNHDGEVWTPAHGGFKAEQLNLSTQDPPQ